MSLNNSFLMPVQAFPLSGNRTLETEIPQPKAQPVLSINFFINNLQSKNLQGQKLQVYLA